MTRVKYEYDGSTGAETTANFSGAEETAQDSVDTANQANYKTYAMEAKTSMNDNMRSLMEVM
jgi:hypothetical protein